MKAMSSRSFTNVVTEASLQELWQAMDNLNKKAGNKPMGILTYNFTCLPSPHSPQSHTYTSPLCSTLCSTMGVISKNKKGTKLKKPQTNQPNKMICVQKVLRAAGSVLLGGLWENVRSDMEKAIHTKDCLAELSTGDDHQGRHLPSKQYLPFILLHFDTVTGIPLRREG